MRAPDFWTSHTPVAKAAASLLSPLAALYGCAAALRMKTAHVYRPRISVLCVGNLTSGGTGKTPIALAVAKALKARGLKPVFLTRGYGGALTGPELVDAARHGADDVGDEALLLVREAPTIVARNRAAGARFAETQGADVIVMDDGFQNPSVAKDVSIVVIDGETGFGNGRVLPAGPLREPVARGLARASAVVVMGDGDPALPDYSGPVLRARLVPRDPAVWRGQKVLAFAGIGRPEKFFATLRVLGAEVREEIAFADHHPYTDNDLEMLHAKAREKNLTLVTTEKDHARLAPSERARVLALPVVAEFVDAALMERILDRLAHPGNVRPV